MAMMPTETSSATPIGNQYMDDLLGNGSGLRAAEPLPWMSTDPSRQVTNRSNQSSIGLGLAGR
jgi:hypothetical protein